MEIISQIESKVRDVPDFPKPGIMFKDITPVLNDAETFSSIIRYFAKRYQGQGISNIVGIESRGFIFGAALAHELGVGFSVVRKPGKLPYKTEKEEYALEYGTDTLEIHVDALTSADKVVIIDDLLATGGTAAATKNLVGKLGATIAEFAFVIALGFLNGNEKLAHDYHAIIKY